MIRAGPTTNFESTCREMTEQMFPMTDTPGYGCSQTEGCSKKDRISGRQRE